VLLGQRFQPADRSIKSGVDIEQVLVDVLEVACERRISISGQLPTERGRVKFSLPVINLRGSGYSKLADCLQQQFSMPRPLLRNRPKSQQ
jgi:hypothetical protein